MKWLDGQITALRERLAKTRALNRAMVEHDIAAMRSEVDDAHAILELYAALSERTKDITIHDLCRLLGDGWSYPQLRKRVQLLEAWDLYIERRRAAGDSGRYGLAYALELISDDEPRSVVIDDATDSHQRESYLVLPSSPRRGPPLDRIGQPPAVRFGADGDGASYGGRTGRRREDNAEHTTPRRLFDLLGTGCTLDVACTADSALCPSFITQEQDALRCEWEPGHIAWMNAPYENLYAWNAKAVEYVESGRGKSVRALLPCWTDTHWFHDFAPLGNVTVIRGRQKFGNMKGQSPFPSILIEYTRESIRAGRERLARGDHSILVNLIDLLPAMASPTHSQRREPLRSPPDRPRGLLTPPTIRQILDARYPAGVHDMCPHPRPEGFDALSMKRWPGPVDFINMPYLAYDEINGRSPLAWVTKMIEQHDLYGNELVALMPIYDAINRLLLAGATIEPLGRQKFIDPQSGQLAPHPPSVALLTLRGTH